MDGQQNIPWGILWQEHESRDGTTQVAESDVHGNTNTSLQRASDVVTVPGNTHRDQRINTRSGEKCSKILNSSVVGGCKHGESDDGGAFEDTHEDTTLLSFVGEETGCDCENACYDVWWDGHELRLLGGVSQIFHDSVFNQFLPSIGQGSLTYVGKKSEME